MAYGIVYIATNTVNGKQYVGQTRRSLEKRWQLHLQSARNGSTGALHRAILKYGAEAFKIEQIDVASSLEELNKKEAHCVDTLKTLAPAGYNLTSGGDSFLLSEEARQKISEAAVGRIFSDKTRKKLSEAASNRVVSDETRRRLSEANRGHVVLQETREKISKSRKGFLVSEETRKKLSEAMLFRKVR